MPPMIPPKAPAYVDPVTRIKQEIAKLSVSMDKIRKFMIWSIDQSNGFQKPVCFDIGVMDDSSFRHRRIMGDEKLLINVGVSDVALSNYGEMRTSLCTRWHKATFLKSVYDDTISKIAGDPRLKRELSLMKKFAAARQILHIEGFIPEAAEASHTFFNSPSIKELMKAATLFVPEVRLEDGKDGTHYTLTYSRPKDYSYKGITGLDIKAVDAIDLAPFKT